MVLDVPRNPELSRDLVMQTVTSLKGGLGEVTVVYLVTFHRQKGGLQSDSSSFGFPCLGSTFLLFKLV